MESKGSPVKIAKQDSGQEELGDIFDSIDKFDELYGMNEDAAATITKS